jgi:hypothetical protein
MYVSFWNYRTLNVLCFSGPQVEIFWVRGPSNYWAFLGNFSGQRRWVAQGRSIIIRSLYILARFLSLGSHWLISGQNLSFISDVPFTVFIAFRATFYVPENINFRHVCFLSSGFDWIQIFSLQRSDSVAILNCDIIVFMVTTQNVVWLTSQLC